MLWIQQKWVEVALRQPKTGLGQILTWLCILARHGDSDIPSYIASLHLENEEKQTKHFFTCFSPYHSHFRWYLSIQPFVVLPFLYRMFIIKKVSIFNDWHLSTYFTCSELRGVIMFMHLHESLWNTERANRNFSSYSEQQEMQWTILLQWYKKAVQLQLNSINFWSYDSWEPLFVQQSHLQGFLNNINFWVCTGIQAQKQTYSVLNVALVFLLLSTSLNIHIYTQFLGWSFTAFALTPSEGNTDGKLDCWFENMFTPAPLCDKRDKSQH